MRGVSPGAFKCESVASIPSMEKLLGAGIKVQETGFAPPPGVARQCAFSRKVEDRLEMWSFDVDCRDSAHQDARDRMVQHTACAKKAEDASDAGPRPGTEKLSIGKGGLDHHGVALLFIDDDTPCHVRVLGLDAERRKKFARLLAKNLTPDTAPIRLTRANLQRTKRRSQ